MTDPAKRKTRDVAEQLLANEAVAAAPSEEGITAAFQVCDKLRLPLTTLAGAAGFQSLLLRALTLAKREAPALSAVQISADGMLKNGDVESNLKTHDPEPGTLLVAHLIGLLFTFIGETLTLRLIQDVWPDVSLKALTAEGIENHEPRE